MSRSRRGSTCFSFFAASAGSMICARIGEHRDRGHRDSEDLAVAVGDLGALRPAAPTVDARLRAASPVRPAGGAGRCGISGCRMVASASFPITAMNSRTKPSAATTSRPRVFSNAARRSRSGAVTRTCSIRGTASARVAPRRFTGRPKELRGAESGSGGRSIGSLMSAARAVGGRPGHRHRPRIGIGAGGGRHVMRHAEERATGSHRRCRTAITGRRSTLRGTKLRSATSCCSGGAWRSASRSPGGRGGSAATRGDGAGGRGDAGSRPPAQARLELHGDRWRGRRPRRCAAMRCRCWPHRPCSGQSRTRRCDARPRTRRRDARPPARCRRPSLSATVPHWHPGGWCRSRQRGLLCDHGRGRSRSRRRALRHRRRQAAVDVGQAGELVGRHGLQREELIGEFAQPLRIVQQRPFRTQHPRLLAQGVGRLHHGGDLIIEHLHPVLRLIQVKAGAARKQERKAGDRADHGG